MGFNSAFKGLSHWNHLARACHPFPTLKQFLGSYEFENDREVETNVIGQMKIFDSR
jgi:hypothetical protein